MNVIHVLTSICTSGGTTAKVLSFAQYSSNKIIVFSPSSERDDVYMEEWKRAGVKLYLYPQGTSFVQTVKMLSSLVKQHNCSIIHTYFPSGMYQACCVKLLNHRVKVVRSMEGALVRRLPVRIFSRLFAPLCSCFVNISCFMERYYTSFEKGKRNIVIYNCASHVGDPKLYSPKNDGCCRMVSISGLNHHKNIPLFVEVSKLLHDKGFYHHISICGDGPYRQYVEEKIKEYGIEEHITLAGYVTDPLPYLYEADIYLHPANCEGFGMAVAEAMAVGMPVIVSDQCALPELIEDGVTGFIRGVNDYLNWCDLIMELYPNKSRRVELGENALSHYSRNFTPSVFASNIDFLYGSL